MANTKTNLDEIIDYPRRVIRTLYENQSFVSLLLNKPNANLLDPDIEDAYYEHMLDYGYVDGTITAAESFCFVDTEIFYSSPTIKDIKIIILVCVHREIMRPSKLFKTSGNLRDNLIREIDYALRNNLDFGIGGLESIDSIRAVAVNKDFSCKVISFSVPNFGEGKNTKRWN